MITTKTVLVLGAGASSDFGFPLGIGLLYEICRISEGRGGWCQICEAGHDPKDLSAFLDGLRISEWGSVDWYLEKVPDHVQVGKAAIAVVMMGFDGRSDLFPPHSPKENWYRLLLDLLDSDGPGSFGDNRLSVITFNYDRSLEHYLLKVLSSPSRGRTKKQVSQDLGSLEIVHVHGSLSPLATPLFELGPQYGSEPTADSIRLATDAIIVVGQAEGDTAEFIRARELLTNADRIVFLGFGYHAESVRRLGAFNSRWSDEDRDGTEVVGTMAGKSTGERRIIKDQVLNGAMPSPSRAAIFSFLNEEFWLQR